MARKKTEQPAASGVFTEEDYWYLGKTMANAYTYALRRRAAAAESEARESQTGPRSTAAPGSAPLVWSGRKPDRAGWWWYRDGVSDDQTPKPVEIYYDENFNDLRILGRGNWFDNVEPWDGVWAGPIPYPVDAPSAEKVPNRVINEQEAD